jgi:NAD(P)-dependent dehydrogenase (short-subunit alcohol dehydrogenase family)
MRLENKVAIVTGAAGGIGRAVAIRLAKEGAALSVNDINLEPLNKVADEIKAMRCRVVPVKANVTNSQEVKQMVKTTLDEFGTVDILVNVAGGSFRARGKWRGCFHEVPEEFWSSVIDLNLKGTLMCCHAVIEHMIQRQRGKIVNIASIAGMMGSSNRMADYSAAKAGVIGFTKALAKELGPYGINVNSVSPGPIATPRFFTFEEETVKRLENGTYLKRLGKPEEVANVVVFLASDEASYVTGQNYPVCGGRSLGW